MKGKWRVIKNPMAGYIVERVRDTSEVVHMGNLEFYGKYGDNKAERQAVADHLNEIDENVSKAAEVEPCAKTRQEEFLEHYQDAHRAKFKNGILQFCPGTFVKGYKCPYTKIGCDDCRKSYWLAEVEE